MKSLNIVSMLLAGANAQQMGVKLFEHADYNSDGIGWSGFYGPGIHNGDFPNDVVTSYQIDEGCCATFYEHYEFAGDSFAKCGYMKNNVPDQWNDVISSMKVECTDANKKEYNGEGDMKLDKDSIDFLESMEAQHLKDKQQFDFEYGFDIMKAGTSMSGQKQVAWYERVPGYIAFVGAWILMLYPNVQDLIMFGYYAMYDFGSSIGIYVEDHENGWTMWAIGQAVLSLVTIGYYVYIFIAEYVLGFNPFDNWLYIIGFWVLNTVNLALPMTKYGMIFYESSLEYDDCGLFNCFWALDNYVGQVNLEIEMYPDIFKTAGLLGNYIIYLCYEYIDNWMRGDMEYYD